MGRKSKFILGLESKRDTSIRIKYFTEEEKRFIIDDYYASGKTKREIWFKYTGYTEEHGGLLKWMRELNYRIEDSRKKCSIATHTIPMKGKNSKTEDNFETLQLKKRVEELEKQLKDAEMKAIAYSTMVDIAEKEFNITIRKKSNTKPSKK